MRSLILILGLLPTVTSAAEPMTADEFDAYVTGKTLTYAEAGVVYGIEEYLPDRRVRWAFTEDQCKEGTWYPSGEAICFVYEDNFVPQCWTFYETAAGLAARYENVEDGRELYEVAKSPDPLVCRGPAIGVSYP